MFVDSLLDAWIFKGVVLIATIIVAVLLVEHLRKDKDKKGE